MKKVVKVIIIPVIICSVILMLFLGRIIYYRMYPGDRIKGSLHITLNGDVLKSDDIRFYSHDKENLNCRLSDDAYVISIKGGEYGMYGFSAEIPQLAETVNFSIMQYNWWNVCEFESALNFNTHENKLEYSVTYTGISETGNKEKYSYSESDSLNNKINVHIGGA